MSTRPATFSEAPWAAFSFEATGARAAEARILEMGIARYQGLVLTSTWCQRFHPGLLLVDGQPGMYIPQPATGLHGISERAVQDSPPFGITPDVAALLGMAALVTYRGESFALPVLRRELTAKGVYPVLPPPVDLFVFLQWHQRHLRGTRLEEVAARFEVPARRRGDLHPQPASADATTCGELLVQLVQAGLVPADIAEAAAQSERFAHELRAEQEIWGTWVYRDRTDPAQLRLGCSKKHQGELLDALDTDFIKWVMKGGLDAPPPEEVQQLLRARLERWGPRGQKDKGLWDQRGPCRYESPGQARVQALIDGAPATCPGCAALSAQLAQVRETPDPAAQAASLGVARENARLQHLLAAHPLEALVPRLAEILPHLPEALQKEILRASSRRLVLLTSDNPPPQRTEAEDQADAALFRAQAEAALERDFERYKHLFPAGRSASPQPAGAGRPDPRSGP